MKQRSSAYWCLLVLAVALLAMALAGCTGGNGTPSTQADNLQQVAPDVLSLLPPLPVGPLDTRGTSSTVQETLDGSDFFASSGDVTVDGSDLTLVSPAGNFSYAMYRYIIGAETPMTSTGVDVTVNSGGVWVALANYGSGTWILRGPFSGDVTLPLNQGDYISPGLNYFMCVFPFSSDEQASLTIHSTSLTYDDGLPAPPNVTGITPLSGELGASVMFSAVNTGGAVDSWSWDFGGAATPGTSNEVNPLVELTGNPGTFTVNVTATNQADSSQFSDSFEITAPPVVDYLGTMKGILTDNCMPCHSTANATFSIVLDTYWNANENASDALNKAKANHAPSGSATLTPAEIADFQNWVDNGLMYGEVVSWTNYTQGITASRCSPCHTGGSSSGGANFDTYASTAAKAEAAWARIRVNEMPQSGGPLTAEQKDKWLAWIEQGKPEN